MASQKNESIIKKNYFNVEVSLIVDKRYAHKDGTHNVNVLLYANKAYLHHQTGLKLINWSDATPREQQTEKKNDFFIRVAISDKMRELIPQSDEKLNDYVFPYLRGAKDAVEIRRRFNNISNRVNVHLKIMVRKLGLEKDITPTFARHSFATILRREFVPSEFVEYAMGHSLKGAAGNYFGGFTTDQLLKYSSYLIA